MAVVMHGTWIVLLLVPNTHAFLSTPVHQLWALCGHSAMLTASVLSLVAGIALIGLVIVDSAGMKIWFLLPQQLVLGISAAGSAIAIANSHYADGVPRPMTFIAADQLAVLLTWVAHTASIMFLWLIHTHKLRPGGRPVPVIEGP